MAEQNISHPAPLLSYQRCRGLTVSMTSRPPVTTRGKITAARSIVRAVVSAQGDGEVVNLNQVLPFLNMATDFLEEAAAEIGGRPPESAPSCGRD